MFAQTLSLQREKVKATESDNGNLVHQKMVQIFAVPLTFSNTNNEMRKQLNRIWFCSSFVSFLFALSVIGFRDTSIATM